MSLVLAGRRRIYVLLLFHERLHHPSVRPPLVQLQRALDPDLAAGVKSAEHGTARLAVSARMQRRWGRSLFGLSFFVLALDADGSRR
jgi:hypothetical protein